MTTASIGATLYIGTADDATTASAYAALTYTEIGEVENIPEFGGQKEDITFTPVGTGITEHFGGSEDYGTLTVPMGRSPTDAGQIALAAAYGTKDSYAFKLVYADAEDTSGGTDSIEYFHARVLSDRRTVGGASDVTRKNYMLGLTQAIIAG